MNSPNLFAIIVCYEPKNNIFGLISSLVNQKVKPIIIDNSEKIFLTFDETGCFYKKLGSNIGIASAQNIGVDIALRYGAEAIVFLDQDSVITDDLIEKLYLPIKLGKTKISVPIYKNIYGNFFYQIVRCNRFGCRKKITPYPMMPYFRTNIAISSGSMIKASLFNTIGKMDSDLFIDYVDTEWFLRAAQNGETALVVTDAIMEHTIGDCFIDLAIIKIPIHSPIRRYYRLRNAFKLLRYSHIPKLLAIREVSFAIIHQIIILILCTQRCAYLKYACFAVRDGISNVKGKIATKL